MDTFRKTIENGLRRLESLESGSERPSAAMEQLTSLRGKQGVQAFLRGLGDKTLEELDQLLRQAGSELTDNYAEIREVIERVTGEMTPQRLQALTQYFLGGEQFADLIRSEDVALETGEDTLGSPTLLLNIPLHRSSATAGDDLFVRVYLVGEADKESDWLCNADGNPVSTAEAGKLRSRLGTVVNVFVQHLVEHVISRDAWELIKAGPKQLFTSEAQIAMALREHGVPEREIAEQFSSRDDAHVQRIDAVYVMTTIWGDGPSVIVYGRKPILHPSRQYELLGFYARSQRSSGVVEQEGVDLGRAIEHYNATVTTADRQELALRNPVKAHEHLEYVREKLAALSPNFFLGEATVVQCGSIECIRIPRKASNSSEDLVIPVGRLPRGAQSIFPFRRGHPNLFLRNQQLYRDILLGTLEYYATYCSDPGERDTAQRLLVLTRSLGRAGYKATLFGHNNEFIIDPIEGHDISRTADFPYKASPFTYGPQFATQWSDIGQELRAILIESFPRSFLITSLLGRISRELKQFPHGIGENAPYVRFVHDWNLIPEDLRAQVQEYCQNNSPELHTIYEAWMEVVRSQDVRGIELSVDDYWGRIEPGEYVYHDHSY